MIAHNDSRIGPVELVHLLHGESGDGGNVLQSRRSSTRHHSLGMFLALSRKSYRARIPLAGPRPDN